MSDKPPSHQQRETACVYLFCGAVLAIPLAIWLLLQLLHVRR
jgi:hypothetical protein